MDINVSKMDRKLSKIGALLSKYLLTKPVVTMPEKTFFRTLEEMKLLIKRNDISTYKISRDTNIAINTLNRIVDGETSSPQRRTLEILDEYLIDKFPVHEEKPYHILRSISEDTIIHYVYDNLARFEGSASFRMFIEKITSDFKSEFYLKEHSRLMKIFEDKFGKEEARALLNE